MAQLPGAALTLAGSVMAGAAHDLATIVAGRAVRGFGAASGYVVARAIVRGNHGADGSAKAMALLFALIASCFLLAPLVGGALLDRSGWRTDFAAAGAGVWLASTLLVLPETAAARPGPQTRAIRHVCTGPFRHRGFVAFMTTHAAADASLCCFVAGAPFLFIDGRGPSP